MKKMFFPMKLYYTCEEIDTDDKNNFEIKFNNVKMNHPNSFKNFLILILDYCQMLD